LFLKNYSKNHHILFKKKTLLEATQGGRYLMTFIWKSKDLKLGQNNKQLHGH